jgi:hypothetical protein
MLSAGMPKFSCIQGLIGSKVQLWQQKDTMIQTANDYNSDIDFMPK